MTTYNKIKNIFLLFGITTLFFFACENKEWDEHYGIKNENGSKITALLDKNEQLTKFTQAIRETGIDKILSNNKLYTIIAPTNKAMSDCEGLSKEQLREYIMYHILEKQYYYQDFVDSMKLQTINGKMINIFTDKTDKQDSIRISNKVKKIKIATQNRDINCSNAVIHQIDDLLKPTPNIHDYIKNVNPNLYNIFITEISRADTIDSTKQEFNLSFDKDGNSKVDTNFHKYISVFNSQDEKNDYTLFLPGDLNIKLHRQKMIDKAVSYGYPEFVSEGYYRRLLASHVFKGAIKKDELKNFDTVYTIKGNKIPTKNIDTDKIREADNIASNGIIHKYFDVIYEAVPVDFIDSLLYEAEWGLGENNKPNTLSWDTKNTPYANGGQDPTIPRHLFVEMPEPDKFIEFTIPNVFKGKYNVFIRYKDACGTLVQLTVNDQKVGGELDLQKDHKPQFPVKYVGQVEIDKFGKQKFVFTVTKKYSALNSISLDYILLKPIE